MHLRSTTKLAVIAALAACTGNIGAADDDDADVPFAYDQFGWSCDGLAGKTQPPGGSYYATTFGCWSDANGKMHYDSGDNCVPACTYKPGWSELCGKRNGPQCLAYVNWYAADADRFGCFARLLVQNPKNGRRAVVAVVDRGPNCTVEKKAKHAVIDLSHPASEYLLGGPHGWSDAANVIVSPVDAATPLGPYLDKPVEPPPSNPPPADPPADPPAQGPIVIDDAGAQFAASSYWKASSNVSGYWGKGYAWRSVGASSDPAAFAFHLDGAHHALVEARWPAASDRSTQAPFLVFDGGALLGKVYVNQREQGNTWVKLGTFHFAGGDAHVDLSRWTTGGGVVVADAVRITPLD
jgi:hypothetical protein